MIFFCNPYIDLFPLKIYEIEQTTKKYGIYSYPKTSAPINIGAKSVFVALPNTAV